MIFVLFDLFVWLNCFGHSNNGWYKIISRSNLTEDEFSQYELLTSLNHNISACSYCSEIIVSLFLVVGVFISSLCWCVPMIVDISAIILLAQLFYTLESYPDSDQ